jgi:hypothetical protein
MSRRGARVKRRFSPTPKSLLDARDRRAYLLLMNLTEQDVRAMDARDAGLNGDAAVMAIRSGFSGFAAECALLAAQSAFRAFPELREGK